MRNGGPAGILLLISLLSPGCGRNEKVVEPEPSPFLNLSARVDYVGAGECTACHQNRASSHAHTGMGRAFYPMSAEVAVEDFTGANEIEIAGTGLRYRMTERDGRYYQKQFVVDSGGRELAADEREMIYVIGSGNHARSYVGLEGDRLFQLPICWYPQESLWDLCPGYERKNENFSREVTLSCVFCHNGRMEAVPGARNRYRDPIPRGIGCERCHGPGRLHVERWRKGVEYPPSAMDPTIVNPARLPREERIQVCMQCHLGDSKTTERVGRAGRSLNDYRPGMTLTEVMVPFYFRQVSRIEFGLSAQADRLLRSRCYQESGGRIECLTCHDPHVTVYEEDRPDEFFREKCLGCHQAEDCSSPPAERRSTRPADDCVACHMRKAEADDQRHAVFTDHWIRRDTQEERHGKRPRELVPVLPDSFDRLTEAEQAFHRGRAQLLRGLELPGAAKKEMWSGSESSLRLAARKGMDTADTWFFLGKLLAFQGRWDEAEEAFSRALERDGGHHDAAFNLGTARIQVEKVAEAAAIFERLLLENPEDTGALAELGRCMLMSGRPGQALELYDRAIGIEPSRASLRSNRAVALGRLGRLDEALSALESAVRIDPDDPQVWSSYSGLLAELGRSEESAEAGRLAGNLSPRRTGGAKEMRGREAPGRAP